MPLLQLMAGRNLPLVFQHLQIQYNVRDSNPCHPIYAGSNPIQDGGVMSLAKLDSAANGGL